MPKEINCEKVKENIDKLKTLKNEFLVEMERIKKDGIAGNIYELKKEIEEIKGVLDDELFWYFLDKGVKKEKEKELNKELEEYFDLTKVSQEIKDRIINRTKSIEDYSKNILYPNLQTVAGDLTIPYAITFSANSMRVVKGYLDVKNATTFLASSLQTVERIFLRKSNFKKFFKRKFLKKYNDFNWDQAEKEGRLVLPEKIREKVRWI